MPQTLKPNTCNSCYEINLTKVGFGNGGHCCATIVVPPTRIGLWHKCN
jgi:hypothetical protein